MRQRQQQQQHHGHRSQPPFFIGKKGFTVGGGEPVHDFAHEGKQ